MHLNQRSFERAASLKRRGANTLVETRDELRHHGAEMAVHNSQTHNAMGAAAAASWTALAAKAAIKRAAVSATKTSDQFKAAA